MPVKIKVKTTIRNGEEAETYELITFGHYYQKVNASYLRYEEYLEEGTVKTVVKASGGEGSILRKGALDMKLSFQKDQTLPGTYKTPYGLFDIHTSTSRLSHEFDESRNEGFIDILYNLTIQGSQAGIYHMLITFEEEKE
jgi:uncharacterized beta-barrel protein YwiB (DUF1934 family)